MNRPVEQPPSDRWQWARKVNAHPVAYLLGFIAIPIIALGIDSVDLLHGWNDPPASTSPSSASSNSESSPPTAGASAIATQGAAPEGSCLDADNEATPCDAPHVSEVFDATGDCSVTSLLRYLGGKPDGDVLLSSLEIASTDDHGASLCTVSSPIGSLVGNNEDVLLSTAGDAWRRCLDELMREIPCANEHKSEVIYDGISGGEAVDCARRADEYLDTPFAHRARDLELLQNDRTCVISARGDNILTGSLRRLGTSALPLEAQN